MILKQNRSDQGEPDGLRARFLKDMAVDLAPLIDSNFFEHHYTKEMFQMTGKGDKLYRFTRIVIALLHRPISLTT